MPKWPPKRGNFAEGARRELKHLPQEDPKHCLSATRRLEFHIDLFIDAM